MDLCKKFEMVMKYWKLEFNKILYKYKVSVVNSSYCLVSFKFSYFKAEWPANRKGIALLSSSFYFQNYYERWVRAFSNYFASDLGDSIQYVRYESG